MKRSYISGSCEKEHSSPYEQLFSSQKRLQGLVRQTLEVGRMLGSCEKVHLSPYGQLPVSKKRMQGLVR